MITGMHAIVYSKQAERAREFFKDILGFESVDAGGGWLIFALPPAELAVHPTEGAPSHELYLICDDVQRTTEELAARGIATIEPITDQRWGLVTRLRLPGGDEIGLYEPRHPQPGAPGGPSR